MALIDISYFFGELFIPQKAQDDVNVVLGMFITKYEASYLEKVLGYSFSKIFNEGLTVDPIDSRWTDLKNGAEYVDAKGHTKKWPGMINNEKISPIANYIYYWYLRDAVSTLTTGAVTQANPENASVVSPAPKAARAWNEMVNLTEILHDFLLNKKSGSDLVYPEFDIKQAKCYGKINALGI